MRVAIVSNITAPYRSELFEYAAAEVDYLKVYFQAFIEKNRNWEEFPSLKYPHEYLSRRGLQVGGRYLGLYTNVRSRLKVDRPDVVVAYGFSTATIGCSQFCRDEKVPLVIANDGTIETDPSRGLEGMYRRRLIRRCQGFIAASTSAAEYFVALGADPGRISIVPLSSDLVALASGVANRRVGLRNGQDGLESGPVVCFPTRLIRSKRIVDACKAVLMAATDLPGIQLKIAGDGPLRRRLGRWVDVHGANRIELVGMLSWPQMLDLYAASDLLVFTGTRERFGMVILEALAAGLPVISYSKAGAAVQFVRDGVNGYGVDEGDIIALASSIRKAVSSKSHYADLRMGAASIVTEHDVRVRAGEFANALRATVSGQWNAEGIRDQYGQRSSQH